MRVRMGDLLASDAQTLVNTVNCVGVMGKGIALEFKRRFPEMFRDYVERCNAGTVRIGRPYLFRRSSLPWILNFPTKHHWRAMSRLEDIAAGLDHLEKHYQGWGITSLAVPPLGCGNGQLEWSVVGPALYRHLSRLNIPVELYAPHGTPHAELTPEFLLDHDAEHRAPERSHVQPGWVILVEILQRIDEEPYHWPVGRVAFQKLAYFATTAGVDTGLNFQRGSYGPYSPELKEVIRRLSNNGLIREVPLGRMLSIRPGSTFESARTAFRKDLDAVEKATAELTDLFVRMNTRQAEMAATVHFAAEDVRRRLGRRPTEIEVYQEVLAWKPRTKPGEVASSVRHLTLLGKLDVVASTDLPYQEDTSTPDPDEGEAPGGGSGCIA